MRERSHPHRMSRSLNGNWLSLKKKYSLSASRSRNLKISKSAQIRENLNPPPNSLPLNKLLLHRRQGLREDRARPDENGQSANWPSGIQLNAIRNRWPGLITSL